MCVRLRVTSHESPTPELRAAHETSMTAVPSLAPSRTLLPDSALDALLTAQIAVAWAGEGGDPARLRWWRTFMVHEDGGLALFADLTPGTHRWAVFQGAREAARRVDAAMRARDADADRLYTLFRFGYEIDERLDERLLDHKRANPDPFAALPGLADVCTADWSVSAFTDWVAGHGAPGTVVAPAGRRLTGAPPSDVETRARHLVGALLPLSPAYPMPHYKVG